MTDIDKHYIAKRQLKQSVLKSSNYIRDRVINISSRTFDTLNEFKQHLSMPTLM